MALAHFRMLIHEFLNEDPDMAIDPRVTEMVRYTLKYTLPVFAENFANLCTAKLKSTLVDNR